MNPAIHAVDPDLGRVNSSFFTSKLPETISSDTCKSERGFSYGIASVFALMLVLVVTLGVMLWVH